MINNEDSTISKSNLIKQKSASGKSSPSKTKTNNLKRKLLFIFLGVLLVSTTSLLLLLYKIYNTGNSLFDGNIFSAIIKDQPLKTDVNGRANFLIIGTSEDDAGHSGAMLTDSIMIVSVDPTTYKANTISIPRDLWVQYEAGCMLGNQGKINAVYFCGKNAGKSDDEAIQSMARTVTTVTGLDIPYYAKINYAVIRDTVNTLGNITVTINSEDPRGVYDKSANIKLPNGSNTLNGEQALNLARARNSGAGYGLSRSNFDRELNQQLIAKAILDKALKSGILANPVKSSKLMDSIGKDVVTNIPAGQLKSLKKVTSNTQASNIATIDLAPKGKPLLVTANKNGQSIVTTTTTYYDYSLIHQAIASAIAPTQQSRTKQTTL